MILTRIQTADARWDYRVLLLRPALYAAITCALCRVSGFGGGSNASSPQPEWPVWPSRRCALSSLARSQDKTRKTGHSQPAHLPMDAADRQAMFLIPSLD